MMPIGCRCEKLGDRETQQSGGNTLEAHHPCLLLHLLSGPFFISLLFSFAKMLYNITNIYLVDLEADPDELVRVSIGLRMSINN
jgi:hypothetical protein